MKKKLKETESKLANPSLSFTYDITNNDAN